AYGGLGLSRHELGIAAGEMGRVLYASPWLATAVMAVTAIDQVCQDADKTDYFARIAEGDLVATLGGIEEAVRGDRAALRLTSSSADEAVIDGSLRGVLEAESADLIDRKSTRLNSSHVKISYAVFCLKKKNNKPRCRVAGFSVLTCR